MKYKKPLVILLILAIVLILVLYFRRSVGNKDTASQKEVNPESTFLLTVFLKHDQSKTLDEIQKKLSETGFYKKFPPKGIEIESWKIVMGVGQVVTLKVPPSRLREVNIALEKTAWGSYHTEFYPTYDYLPIYNSIRDSMKNKNQVDSIVP
jgi:hypothetical protein